jgi:hypothetical protein
MLKKLFGRRGSTNHRRRSLTAFAGAAALMLFATTLATPAAQAQSDATTQVAAPAGILDPWVSPNPEASAFGKWTQQQATDWVNNCPAARFCTWIRDGEYYTMFQFYRCGTYSLSGWLGTTNFYNHQNVQVETLGSRHEHIGYIPTNWKFITNWDKVWYINLCT